jgi:DNA adenine methylase
MPGATAVESPIRVRPFLKWAGGKRQLVRELRRFVPSSFRAYHEPFLGSGAVFFDLWRDGVLADRVCRLTDINADLVGCYRAVARDVGEVIRELNLLAARHQRHGRDAYYRVRDEAFNPRRRALGAKPQAPGTYPPDLAAMFVYLNRTGYNGLFRLNARGDFNVPAGRYPNPRICDAATLQSVAEVLRRPEVAVEHDSFTSVLSHARPGDLVYLDPPYAPLSATARFTSYTSPGFSDDDQVRLQELVLALAGNGCHVILSNSTAPLVTELYGGRAAREAGLRPYRVSARRAINSRASHRGEVDEYVISNRSPVPPLG